MAEPKLTAEVTGTTPTTSITNKIRAELNNNGILNPSHFAVKIGLPEFFNVEDAGGLLLMCNHRAAGASLPGMQLNTSSIRRYGVGLEERKPVSSIVVDQSLNFVVDRDGVLHNFFSYWMNNIVRSDVFSVTDAKNTANGLYGSRLPGSVLYKSQYTTNLTITVYQEATTPKTSAPTELLDRLSDSFSFVKSKHSQNHLTGIKIILHNAYPIAMGDVQLNWGGSSDLMMLPITFTYTHFTHEKVVFDSSAIGTKPEQGLLSLGAKGLSTAQLLSTLKKPTNLQDILAITNNAKTVASGFNGVRIGA